MTHLLKSYFLERWKQRRFWA